MDNGFIVIHPRDPVAVRFFAQPSSTNPPAIDKIGGRFRRLTERVEMNPFLMLLISPDMIHAPFGTTAQLMYRKHIFAR